MAYYYSNLYFKDNINCSYVNRVSIKEEGHVDFIYQFVNTNYCTQRNDNFNTLMNCKIIEPPNKITKYKDFKERICEPMYDHRQYTKSVNQIPHQHVTIEKEYINIEFYEACYPIKVSLFAPECCFANVRRIWAQNSDDQWFPLWSTWNTYIRDFRPFTTVVRLITLVLCRSYDFKTKMLKIEFWPKGPDTSINHTKIDAVILIGTSEFVLPKQTKENLNPFLKLIFYEIYSNILNQSQLDILHPEDPYSDILQLQQNFDKYCIICKSDVIKSFYKSELGRKQMVRRQKQSDRYLRFEDITRHFNQGYMYRFLESYSNEKCIKDIKPSSDESKELSSCNLSALSDELVLEILKNSDMKSLSRISRVNKRFNNLSRNPELYKCLNLRNIHFTYMHTNFDQLFNYFALRCKNLQQLDLSHCRFVAPKFTKFFKTCCSRLTHLRLNNCYIINCELQDIWKTCKNLKELDLSCCQGITNKDISYLKNLQCLECLYLEAIPSLEAITLCEILKGNRHMRDLNLVRTKLLTHEVATELKNSCPNLEKLNLASCFLTSQSICTLAGCKNLKEVDFTNSRWSITDNYNIENIFSKLFSSCQRLEKINLNYFQYLTECELKTLALCKNLKVLNLIGMPSATPDICSLLFINCPKLNEINLTFSTRTRKEQFC